ncbi:Aldo/keto reductase [Trematosphaeria pertusa]|uniref:Aldo/keto reductase n=1 Tax=Trematosphaeria pertusa TaxID=390896 RepID=A0A6A6I7I1_9PLEO|nr:Aldo/keto reductase [Trematosphaeria pertusa]KAF2246306.1 Aldo/keto reductase [Trematosphaeria pertusa]
MTPHFPQRKIGDDLISAIGLGCMGMSIPTSSGLPDEDECLKVLTAAADMGINFWDTSDAYGDNEKILGRWFRETGRRDEIFLATKFGVKRTDTGMVIIGKPEYVKEACESSLQRLGTNRIDLYYQHRVDPATPIEKTVGAMAELKKEGKIRYLGLSECSGRTLQRACKVHPIAACQMEFSPFALDLETTGFLTMARDLGVGIVAYAPLGKGFLTGAIKSRDDFEEKDMRKTHPRFSQENFASNLRLVDMFASFAKEKNCTTGQATLAWVMAQGQDFIPIPGTKHINYLKENADAVNVTFSKEDEERVRAIIDSIGGAKGARYPPAFQSACFGDSPELENE